jgi:Ca-activated chloride channel family protein
MSLVTACLGVVIGVSSGAAAQEAAAPSGGKVMIVLDASGSMWGQIDGKAKIVIAREVIRDLMSGWDPAVEVGLSAYGHREKGRCDDIQTLVPVSAGAAGKVADAAQSVQPKGKTPLSNAVRQAAEALRYSEDAATVILVSDGKETCEADPCATGKALAESGVDFKAHVIGFDVSEADQVGLRCLAENTGGMFLGADDAAGLRTALATTVQEVKERKAESPGYRFRALYADGGEEVKGNLSWAVYEAEANSNGERRKVAFSYDPVARFKLEPGRYVVVVTVGAAEASMDLDTASDGPGLRDLVLNAGRLKASAKRTAEAHPLKGDIVWAVYEPEPDAEGRYRKVTFSYDSVPVWTLPAGDYTLNAERGAAKGSAKVVVRAGETAEHDIVLGSGSLAVRALLAGAGAPMKDLNWQVYAIVDGKSDRSRAVAFSYNSEPRWELPAGRYLVEAVGKPAVASAEVQVAAGKSHEKTLDFEAGYLRAETMGAAGSLAWNVFLLVPEGGRKKVTFAYGARPSWTLEPGRYAVVVEDGTRKVEKEVEVRTGKTTDLVVEMQ